MIRIGIRILLKRSTPFSTPRATTPTVRSIKSRKKRIGDQVDVINELKYAPESADFSNMATGFNAMANTYFVTHPPITQ